jgi:hypothetical protein
MKKWLFLLGGLLVWASHFFLLYGFASIFPGTDLSRWLTIAATCVALGANIGIIHVALGAKVADGRDPLDGWIGTVGLSAGLLSFLAVLWQGFPALI